MNKKDIIIYKLFEENPHTKSKNELLKNSIEVIRDFLKINNINLTRHKYLIDNKMNEISHFYNDNVYLNLNKIKDINNWSYPGYITDVTISGLLAHETGHLLNTYINIKQIKRTNEIISPYYEFNNEEAVAETIRLFILNPNLLKLVAPKRYAKLIKKGIKPIHNLNWYYVLRYANNNIISSIVTKYNINIQKIPEIKLGIESDIFNL